MKKPIAGRGRVRVSATEVANAKRIRLKYQKDIRFVSPTMEWIFFNGIHWERDPGALHVQWLASRIPAIFERLARREREPNRKRALTAAADRAASSSAIRGTIKCLSLDQTLRVESADLDADPFLLNTISGTVHLRTGRLEPHASTDLLTLLAPWTIDPEPKTPLWDAFLHKIFGGDKSVIDYIQRCVGYSITGNTQERVLFILHGDGSNGKSTFLNVIRNALGTYAAASQPDILMERRTGTPTYDIARLNAVRMVVTTESSKNAKLNEGLVKQMTGRDPMVARHMYQSHFEFTPKFKIWLATNHCPEIDGADNAIWNRIRMIPFSVTIPPEEQDHQLEAKLASETPGILRWAVQGCLEWQKHGLSTPSAVTSSTSDFRDDSDPIKTWLDEECEFTKPEIGARTETLLMYTAYSRWSEMYHFPPVSVRTFVANLRANSVNLTRTSKRRYVRDLVLKRKFSDPEGGF